MCQSFGGRGAQPPAPLCVSEASKICSLFQTGRAEPVPLLLPSTPAMRSHPPYYSNPELHQQEPESHTSPFRAPSWPLRWLLIAEDRGVCGSPAW